MLENNFTVDLDYIVEKPAKIEEKPAYPSGEAGREVFITTEKNLGGRPTEQIAKSCVVNNFTVNLDYIVKNPQKSMEKLLMELH